MGTTPFFNPNWWLTTATFLLVSGCQAGDLTLPPDAWPGQLSAVSGYDQRGPVGTRMPRPLVARVTDATGLPVPNVTLRFQSSVPAARLEPAEVRTDHGGYAEAHVWLGLQEGEQTFEALLAEEAAPELKTTFRLLALASPPPGDDTGGEDNGNDGNGGNGGGGGEGGGNRGDDRDDEREDDDHDDDDRGRGRGRGGDNGRGNDDDRSGGRGRDDD